MEAHVGGRRRPFPKGFPSELGAGERQPGPNNFALIPGLGFDDGPDEGQVELDLAPRLRLQPLFQPPPLQFSVHRRKRKKKK